MTDLTEKTPALDEQSAVENSEEIMQTPSVWALSAFGCFKYGNKCIGFRPCNHVGFNLHQYGCFTFS